MKIVDYRTGEFIEVVQPYRNQANYKSGEFAKDKEVNEEPSMTVPDMSFTIPEILERYVRGVAPNVEKKVSFASEEGFDDVDPTQDPAFDLSDATAMLEDVELKLSEAKVRKSKTAKKSDDEGGTESKQDETKNLS